MSDISPEERARIARVTEALIERVLDQPARKLRHRRGVRGRLAGIEALRHLFGLDEEKD
jgi:glutamyl-tRNA reductase